jgi:predicted nucleotidyltransferase
MSRTISTVTRTRHRAKRRPRAQIEPLLPRVKKILEDLYGDRLVSVILYGSFARDKATEDSDIDIAVVLKGKTKDIAALDKEDGAIYDFSVETGELISIFPVSVYKLRRSDWPLYCHMRTEGIEL